MTDQEEHLFDAVAKLLRMQRECSSTIVTACGLSEVTVKQMAYLKVIDEEGEVTFSRLAERAGTSKPTITEMINRCVQMDCVYREPSPSDARVRYIRLTEKGRTVVRADEAALRRTVERMVQSLEEEEMDLLIRLLGKVE